jgi:hypothetical protein
MVMKNCIVCREPIFRKKGGGQLKLRRGPDTVTCSRPCSRIYARVYNYFKNTQRRKQAQLNKGNREDKEIGNTD